MSSSMTSVTSQGKEDRVASKPFIALEIMTGFDNKIVAIGVDTNIEDKETVKKILAHAYKSIDQGEKIIGKQEGPTQLQLKL